MPGSDLKLHVSSALPGCLAMPDCTPLQRAAPCRAVSQGLRRPGWSGPFVSAPCVQASQKWLSSTAVAGVCSLSLFPWYGDSSFICLSAIPNSLPNGLVERKPRHITHLLENLLRFLLLSGSLQLLWQTQPFTTGTRWLLVSLAIFSLLGFQQVRGTSIDLMVPLPLYLCPCCFFPWLVPVHPSELSPDLTACGKPLTQQSPARCPDRVLSSVLHFFVSCPYPQLNS